MKKNKLILVIYGLLLLSISSCTKDFLELNTNPNTSPNAMPESFLGPAIYKTVTANVKRAHQLNNELMQDQVSTSSTDEVHRYIILPKESKNLWDGWYPSLKDFRTMYENAETLGDKQFMAISLICDAWVGSMITDCFGDVPYEEACQGDKGILQPQFDKQSDIYLKIYQKLERANELLSSTEEEESMTIEQASLDPIYHGEKTLWRKFGNSLYLRLLMRASNKENMVILGELTIASKITHIIDNPKLYPLISSNDESAILPFQKQIPYTSPFWGGRDHDFNGTNGLTEFFVQTLEQWSDPRLAIWAKSVSSNVYAGIPSGYPYGQTPQALSTWNISMKEDQPLLGNILNYPEVQFLLAEAATRGYTTTEKAVQYYESGVVNAITLWGLQVPEDYLLSEGIQMQADDTQQDKLEKILTQKYFTLLFTGMQQWHEYLRTGYPRLYPLKDESNTRSMPCRFIYPTYIQSLNYQHYQEAVSSMGGDRSDVKMWWQMP